MNKLHLTRLAAATVASLLMLGTVTHSVAQNSSSPIKVDRATESIDMIVKTSRMLEFDYDVPDLVIDNQNIVRVTPLASNKVLLTALKPGFATVTASDPAGNKQTINIMVRGDVRALEMALKQIFPNSNLTASALETGVVLNGTLARADDVSGAIEVASDYFPKIYNNIKLPNSQMIAIEVEVYEVARTKVRELGLDWELLTGDFDLRVNAANNPTNTLTFSVVDNGDQLNGFLQALERRSLARLMDKPILVTMNGRPAEFLQGGEIPFEINQGLGNVTIQFRPFGTKLDVVPIVQGEGTVRLEVRAEVSEPDQSLANNEGVSGFRVRRVNTGVDMKIGHTLALAGDIREETESEVKGIPYLMDMPYVGRAFSRVEESKQEVELVMLLTPRFIGEVDPTLRCAEGPGRASVSPSDCQLYRDGQIEVPRCHPDCGDLPNQPIHPAAQYGTGYMPHQPVGGDGQPVQPPVQQSVPPQPPQQPQSSNFGYPGQQPATSPQARTSGFSLKKLFRR